MIRNLLWILLPLTIVLGTASASAQKARTGTYTDKVYGFSVETPGFILVPSGQQIQRLKVSGPTIEGFAANFTVVVLRKRANRKQYLEQTKKAFATMKLTLDSAKMVKISGRPALQIEYHGKVRGNDLHFLSVSVFRGQDVVTASCTTTEDTFDLYKEPCLKSLKSLKL
jgi:hypothetical protein